MNATVTARLSDLTTTALTETVIAPILRKYDHLSSCRDAAEHATLWSTQPYVRDNRMMVGVAVLHMLVNAVKPGVLTTAEFFDDIDTLEAAVDELLRRVRA